MSSFPFKFLSKCVHFRSLVWGGPSGWLAGRRCWLGLGGVAHRDLGLEGHRDHLLEVRVGQRVDDRDALVRGRVASKGDVGDIISIIESKDAACEASDFG